MKAPIYVKIEKYGEIEDTLRQIKTKIQEAKDILNKISEMKAEEEQELRLWNEDIKAMEEKIDSVEHVIVR